jgi:hypothetical protein
MLLTETVKRCWLLLKSASLEQLRRLEGRFLGSMLLSGVDMEGVVEELTEPAAFLASSSCCRVRRLFSSSMEDTERLLERLICCCMFELIELASNLMSNARFSGLGTARAVRLMSADRRHCA